MKVRVRYLAQLRQSAGKLAEDIDLPEGSCVSALLNLVGQHYPSLRHILLADGRVQRTILIFLGDEQTAAEQVLRDGDEITLLTPIAGGEV